MPWKFIGLNLQICFITIKSWIGSLIYSYKYWKHVKQVVCFHYESRVGMINIMYAVQILNFYDKQLEQWLK